MKIRKGYSLALLAAGLFGLSAPLAKLLLGQVGPVMLAALLYLGCGIGLFVLKASQRFAGITWSEEAKPAKDDLGWLLGAVLIGGVAAPIVMMVSLTHTSAATASLLLNFESIATVLVAALLFREAVGRRVWIAVVLVALAGCLLSLEIGGTWMVSIGALGVLLACVLWGLDNNLTQRISAKDPMVIALVKGIAAGCISLVLALTAGERFPGMSAMLGALVLGFVSYGLSVYLYILSLRSLGTARTGAIFGTAPFIGVVGSLILFSVTLNWQFLAALPLMLMGAYLLLSERHGHVHTHDEYEHDHAHDHDTHHQHEHDAVLAGGARHAHVHKHLHMVHEHSHTPDIHHRHSH
ncbi:DMT family transporter [bacterium]|nr:DMT family transporter [bacterium]